MGSAELTAHTRLSLRYDRKAEPCHKDAFVQQHVTHFDSGRRFAHDDRDDRSLARQRFETRLGDGAAKITGVIAKFLDELRVVLEMLDCAERARRDRGWKRVGEELRPRPLCQHVTQRRGPGDESTRRAAQCLAQCGSNDVNLSQNAEMLSSSPTRRAQDASAM